MAISLHYLEEGLNQIPDSHSFIIGVFMLNLMRNGERRETRVSFKNYSKLVRLSFFHEIEDPRRAFEKNVLDLSKQGLSFEVEKKELEQFAIGDYLRIHLDHKNKVRLARICYIKSTKRAGFYRIGINLNTI